MITIVIFTILINIIIGIVWIIQLRRIKKLDKKTAITTPVPNGIIKDLSDKNEKFRLLVEKSLDGIVIAKDLKFLYVNQAFCDFLGYSSDELYAMDPTSIILPADKDRVLQVYYDRMAGILDTSHYTTVFIKKDGSHINVDMYSTTIEINGEKASFVTIRDITENVILQKSLIESESKYRMLVEKSTDGICITQDGKYKFANPALCRMVGYCEEELYSMDGIEIIAPEYRNKMLEIHKNRMAGDISSINYRVKLLHKEGGLVDIDALSSTLEYKGKPAGFFTLHDITESNRLQQTLLESEAKYRNLVEKALDGINITQDGVVKFANQAFCEILGYELNEIIGSPALNYITEEFHDKLNQMHTKRMQGNHFTTIYSCKAVRKSGEYRDVELNVTTIDFEGRPAAFIITRDISERNRMQAALAESEQLHRLIIDGINDGVFDWNIDTNEVVFSKRYKEILGYTDDEFKNQLSEWVTRLHPEEAEEVLKKNNDYIIGKTDKYQAEYRLKHKNGEYRWILARGICLYNTSGKAFRMVGTHIDITERRNFQDELEQSMQKYRDLAEMLPQTIFELDLEGNLTYINQAGMKAFGYTQSAIGRSAFSSIAPEDHERLRSNMQKSLYENVYSKGNEYIAIRESGERFPVMIYAAAMFIKGKVVGIRGMIVDITDRKAMENALRESEANYKLLVENSQDGILIIANDEVVFANKTICKLLGRDMDEICCMPVLKLLLPEDRFRAQEISQRRKQGDVSIINEILHYVTKNGSIIEADTFSSVINYNGQVANFYTLHDITESKRMQLVLKESEEKYRQLFVAESDAIFMIDADFGQILDANPAASKIYGYEHDELIHMRNVDVSAQPEQTAEATKQQKTLVPLRYHRKKDGTIFPVELSAGFTKLNDQNIQIVTSRDITNRIKSEEELLLAKNDLELLNQDLENRVLESSQKLTEARTQLINLQKENLQSQFEVLKQQVNPHFLFNSLNVLTSLIKLEPDLAETFSEQLSKVYRYVLENKDNELVSIKTELDFLKSYVFLLDIRFVDKLKVNMNIKETELDLQIIPLAMQLLIENAIKHNTMSKKNPLTIDIFIDQEMKLNIVNNLQERESQIISTGVGLKNIQNRYLLLNNSDPEFFKTTTQFIAKIPLIKYIN